jgi:hypothetical protein
MALIRNFTCKSCKNEKYELLSQDRLCSKCRAELARIEENAHLDKLALMPLEDRVRNIERQLWRLRAEQRISALESLNYTY